MAEERTITELHEATIAALELLIAKIDTLSNDVKAVTAAVESTKV